ncbi:MAG TPA: MMPL family transporter [Ilumatobacteraceae bacterium]|nr:MMPL family transporter [Ilumatobacteraceae bacterium]
MLARLARFSFRRRYLMVFAVWVPLLIALNAVSSAVGTDYHTEFNMPNSESKQVQDAFNKIGSKEDAGFPAQIVFTAAQGNDDPAVKAAMEAMFVEVDALEGVKVVSPYSPEGAQQNSAADSPTNKFGQDVSFAQLTVSKRDQAGFKQLAEDVQAIGDKVDVPGLEIDYGGQVFQKVEFPASEVLGILAAIVILLLAFGSVIAMGLPIGTAVIGLGVGMAIVGIASNGFSIPEFGPQMAAMIGLGVGIDYALFIVSRYREHLQMGEDPETATVAAVDSSGRAVIFAGITVIISLLGLFIMGLSFVRGLAVAGAVGVLVMMLASITLLPALLGFTGTRIHTTSKAAATGVALFVLCGLAGVALGQLGALMGIGLLVALALVGISLLPFGKALRKPIPHREEKAPELRFWYRWSRFIQHRPWPFFAFGAAVLVTLALPIFSIRLGFSDEGNQPKDTTVRQAYDTIAEAFGPGTSGPLVLVSTDPAATPEIVAGIDTALAADTDVAFATPGMEVANDMWMWRVYPKTAAQDVETADLVNRLRDDVLPTSGIKVNVGGWTASGIDFSEYLGGRLPLLIGAVLVLSFLLLMIVFRSLLVPLKAVIMNLLSVGASYGVIVAIFQWGWGLGLIGVDNKGPVEAWAPMMLFAIVFGLSMDYEVFLLSRMKEEFDRTGDNGTAVADGLAVTARVITAAAMIMVCVFSAFVLGDDRSLKLFGLGMGVAVLVDATVVRMVLVPATMELLGARNWWIPKWLDRVLPHLYVEGAHPADAAERLLDEIAAESDGTVSP